MELINSTRMVAGFAMGREPSGRDLLVLVVKGTFRLPRLGEDPKLHDEQLPLVTADTFTGEPGRSAPLHEVDYAPRKPRCDALLVGSAYAPGGRPAERVPVGVRIGERQKSFAVVGDRRWSSGLAGARPSPPEPFVTQPISYDVAFGGTDARHDDPGKHDAYPPNPVGRGFHRHLRSDWVDGSPLPNTEAIGRPVTAPDGSYEPMALGPVGRGWEPRRRHAGTYDERWLAEDFPFLPPDFSERYYQAAPEDQQVAALGGAEIQLGNLTPDGQRRFVLPDFQAPIHVFPKKGPREDYSAPIDTLVLEPDLERFTLTWRIARPLRNDIFEIGQVLIGRQGREWWQKREEIAFPVPVVMVPLHRPAKAAGGEGT